MRQIDLTRNVRIPQLLELVSAVGRSTDPFELVDTLLETMRRVYGARGYMQISSAGLAPGEFRLTRFLTFDGRELIDYRSYRNGAPQPIQRGGLVARLMAEGRPTIFHQMDIQRDEALGEALAGYRSLMAIPLVANSLNTDWIILMDPGAETFGAADVEETLLRANMVISMASNMMTAGRLRLANDRIAQEIEQIARIQRSLLPERVPEIPGVRIGASYNTFDRAGGDIYDIRRLTPAGAPDERWALLIGDASGHGPAAAVMMAMFHSILHTYPTNPAGPGELFDHVNRHLCDKSIDQSFITAFMGFYDPRTRRLTYARAGHNPPLVKEFPHRGEPLRLDAVGELPLGIIPNVKYTEASLTLERGQTLILYTDGITEAMRADGSMFELEGIEHSLFECSGEPDCAIHHITSALKAHQGDARPDDDQTLVVMKVL